MVFGIFFEDLLSLYVFLVSPILGHKGSALFFRELERDAETGFRHPEAHV
jgi:hypothetical protein